MMDMSALTGGPSKEEGIPEAPRLNTMVDQRPMVEAAAQERKEMDSMLGKLQRCPWCGAIHPKLICPHISSITFHEGGGLASLTLEPRPQSIEDYVFRSEADLKAAMGDGLDPPEGGTE